MKLVQWLLMGIG